MPAPTYHPEFDWSVEALLCLRTEEALRADPDLAAYFQEISAFELEDLVVSSSLNTPMLAVMPGAVSEEPKGSNRQAEIQTAVEVLIITDVPIQRRGTEDYLLLRLCNAIRSVLLQVALTAKGDDDRFLSCQLALFQRQPGALRLPGGQIARRVQALYFSTINWETRTWI